MIYSDSLGRPNADGGISVIGGIMCDKYFYFHAVSDAPDRRWPIYTKVDDIVSDMVSDGWSCDVSADGFGQPRIRCIHSDTAAVIAAKKTKSDADFAGATAGFVRFGSLPAGGVSINHRDNTAEAGVSAFNAEFSSDGQYRLLLTPVLEVSYLSISDRQAYRLYGDVVGTGADGEPLLLVEHYETI